MAIYTYQNTGTNQVVRVHFPFFDDNPLWELIEGGGAGGGVSEGELTAHENDALNVHGIPNTALLATKAETIPLSQKGAANGVAPLDSGGKIPPSQISHFDLVDFLGETASQGAMLALTGDNGDFTIRTDLSTLWVITGGDPTVLGSWTELSYPTAAVTSVAGKTGAVTLAGPDIASGTIGYARLPVGITSSTVAAGNDSRILNAVTGSQMAGAVSAHAAATDPHGDRAYADSLATAGGWVTTGQMNAAIAAAIVAHSAAADPHGDRAYADSLGGGGPVTPPPPTGTGSYLSTLPAGRALPSGLPSMAGNPRTFVTSNAPAGGIPTNDWWTSILWKKTDAAFGEPLHAHPCSFDTFAGGLGVSYNTTVQIYGTSTGPGEYHFPYVQDFLVGPVGLASTDVKVDGWTDWTVTPYWSDGSRTLKATIGHGLPFAYLHVTGAALQITTASVPTVWSNTAAVIGFKVGGHDYMAFAPTGVTWGVSGSIITASGVGNGYFSVCALPTTAATSVGDRNALATAYGQVAYNHVTNTSVSYVFTQATSTLTTTYTFTSVARQAGGTGIIAALYPHQWNSLTGASPITETYTSARGPMKVVTGISSFQTSMKFHGVLPEVPAVADSSGAGLTTLQGYLSAVQSNPMDSRGEDSYWQGKGLGRAARIAEIADQVGNTAVRDAALNAIRTTLTEWFTATAGKTTKVFYYDSTWSTLLGYPASYGSDTELNDHHFHYGYFIAAAAVLAKFDPTWAALEQYGGMVDILIRDANNYDRDDTRFPYLRDFDVYAGHDWASGHGSFFNGNNQESSSEGMNFANALIQWGQATGNDTVRDAGIYIYTTQAAAIQQYWFDVNNVNFPPEFGHAAVGMVWGSGGAYATWFSAEPEMIQGINMLPITGGHLYLGEYPSYVTTNYNEMLTNNGGPPTVWQDIIWSFLATGNPTLALSNFTGNSGFTSEEGESKAHTYHWIKNLAALGVVDPTITADHPLARVFTNGGSRTYVASNITSSPLTVTFSNATVLVVPAGKTATSGALTWSGGTASGGA